MSCISQDMPLGHMCTICHSKFIQYFDMCSTTHATLEGQLCVCVCVYLTHIKLQMSFQQDPMV